MGRDRNYNVNINAKDNASANIKKASSNFKGLSTTITTAVAAGGALAAGFAVVTSAINKVNQATKESIDLYKTQVQAETKLATALGTTDKSLVKYAASLQAVTTYGDETIITAEAIIAAHIKEEENIKKVTKASLDLAAAKGIDLVSAADMLTKSIVTSTNALQRQGISITNTTNVSSRLEQAVTAVEKSYGGMAEALAKTDAGKMEQLKNIMGDQKELLGEALIPLSNEWNKILIEISKVTFKPLATLLKGISTEIRVIKGESLGYITTTNYISEAMAKGGQEGASYLFDRLVELNKEYDELNKKNVLFGKEKKMADYANQISIVRAALKELTKVKTETTITTTPSTTTAKKSIADETQDQMTAAYGIARAHREKMAALDIDIANDVASQTLAIDVSNNDMKSNMRSKFNARMSEMSIASSSSTYSAQIDQIQYQYDVEAAVYRSYLDNNIITQAEYNRYEVEAEVAKQDEINAVRMDAASTAVEIASNVANQINTINGMVSDIQLEKIDKETDRKKEFAKSTIKNKKVLEKELARIDAEAEKKTEEIAKREKQIALIMAVVNTATAVTKALSSAAPPANFVLAALTGVAGAVQIGLIASQAFSAGGVVQQEYGKSAVGDQHLIRANPGERVLTAAQNQAYERGLSGVTIGGSTIIINGNADASVVEAAFEKSREQQMVDMKSLLNDMDSNGMLSGLRAAA